MYSQNQNQITQQKLCFDDKKKEQKKSKRNYY